MHPCVLLQRVSISQQPPVSDDIASGTSTNAAEVHLGSCFVKFATMKLRRFKRGEGTVD